MENQTEIIIPISTEKDRFAQHLQTENNQRIIFSGQFGSGKTFFLKEFFDKNNDYEDFFLSPVHYSVSRNEDVFEYIKYDILISLFSKETVEWQETHLSNELLLSFFVKENFIKIAKDTIKHAGKVGKIVSEVIEDIGKYQKKFEEFKASSETDQLKEAKTYIDDFRKQIGSIFEYDDNTTLINELLGTIPKEKVLIIDDLDRMDPEHIFRIMNVFAAQFDHERFGYNKFAFDKVIIVCDLDNLRNLFAHKYGSNVDFSGYIDKFYSIEPFKFDNRKALIDNIFIFLQTNSVKSSAIAELIELIEPLFSILIKKDIINLRKFVSKQKIQWKNPFHSENRKLRDYPEYPILIIDFLLFMYGYIHEDLLLQLNEIDINIEWKKNKWIRHLCPLFDFDFISIDQYKFPINLDANFPDLDLTIKYSVDISYINRVEYYSNIIEISKQSNESEIVSKIPIFKLLSKAIERYSTIKGDVQ